MKRSYLLEKLRRSLVNDFDDHLPFKLIAENILSLCEEAGMLPPFSDDMDDCMWEPENQSGAV